MRTELKYVLPNDALSEFRDAIRPFMVLDSHCEGYEERGYTVRSIYLDSPSLRYYHEKQAHLKIRKKVRIRGYNDSEMVFLEIKRKDDSVVVKDRAPITYGHVGAALSADADLTDFTDNVDVGRRVSYHVRRDNLMPTSLVVYEREAFQGRFDTTFRITLDRDMRGAMYPGMDGLFKEDGMREAMPGNFILEIKFDNRFPAWMRSIIAQFGLMQRSASKYCICLDLFEHTRTGKAAVLANASPAHSERLAPENPAVAHA